MNKLTNQQIETINRLLEQEEPGDLEAATMLALKLGSMFPDETLHHEIMEIIGEYN